MQRRNYCERLAKQIHTLLVQGIHPEADVRHYIDSTFAHPTRHELEIILKDPDNCEQDTALELIYFPGRDIQVLLENLIEESHFQQDEEEVILGMLMERKPVTTFYFPDGGSSVLLETPEHVARQFIARLNIHKRISSSVRKTIHQSLPSDHQVPAKVMIRNARFACQGVKADFLDAFLGNTPAMPEDFFRHLEFVLHFLETSPDDTPLKESLGLQKQQHRNNIIRAEQFEQQRRDRNVETMILQGVRMPHFDPQDDMRKIALIDTVSIAIYGRTP